MKLAILLVSLFIGAFLVQDTAAWRYWGGGWGRGWGGWGRGWGWGGGWGWGRGLGWGGYGWGGLYRPWGLYSPYYTLGYRYFRDTMSHGNLSQRADCSYIADKSVFVCQGENIGVECEVVANLTNYVPTKNFELFGIGNLCRVDTTTPVSLTRFNLYPRLLDNSGWLNHTTFVEGHHVNLNLFHSTSYNDRLFGFRIVDVNCYQKLVEIFNHVPVTSYENVTITGENGVTHTVPLFGQVLVRKIAV